MEKGKKFQWSNVLTISFAHMLHDIYSSFLAPILPLLIAKLHMGYTLAGLLSFIQRVPSLLNPFIGLLADKLSLRYFIIIAPSITSVSMSLLGVAPHYLMLLILCLIMGISATIFHVPAPVMIKRVSGERTGMGMSFYMMGGELARTLGPIIILWAVSMWGLEGTWRLIPFGLGTSMVLYFRVRKVRIADDFEQKQKKRDIKSTLNHLMPLFLIISGFTLSRALMKSALTTFLPIYLNLNRGDTLWMAGISLAVLQFAGAAGTLYCGSLSDKIGRKTTLVIIASVSPLLMGLFLLLKGFFTFPLLILIGFFLFAPNPVMLALFQETGSDRPAFVNSIYMTINFFMQAITNLLIGVLGDLLGLDTTYILAAVLAVLAVPFALRINIRSFKE